MKIPRFWASATGSPVSGTARSEPLKAFGWSDLSVDQARARARETLARLLERVERGMPFPERYAYAQRPIREEILAELRAGSGGVSGLVTRNAYGATILNTADVMFVDIDDTPPPLRSMLEVIRGWFGMQPSATNEEPGLPGTVTAFAPSRQWPGPVRSNVRPWVLPLSAQSTGSL